MDFSQIQRQAADSVERRSVDMSDVWGEGAIVYARPITTADHIKVSKSNKQWPQGDLFEGGIHLLTLICQNEEGSRFFPVPLKDRKTLAALPVDEVQRLLTELASEPDTDDEDDPVKNF